MVEMENRQTKNFICIIAAPAEENKEINQKRVGVAVGGGNRTNI